MIVGYYRSGGSLAGKNRTVGWEESTSVAGSLFLRHGR